MRLKRPDQARRHVLLALSEAPRYRDAQRLLLELVDRPLEPPLEEWATDAPHTPRPELLPPLEELPADDPQENKP